MRICIKKKLKIDDKIFEKHQEGHILGFHWRDDGAEFYYVDIEGKTYTIETSACDILKL